MKRLPLNLSTFRCLAAAFALATIAVSPAMASAITFANSSDVNVSDFSLSTSTAASVTTTTLQVTSTGINQIFSFVGLALPVGVDADLSVLATSTSEGSCQQAGCAIATPPAVDQYTQGGFTGSFAYIEVGGANPGANLLSGTFTNASFGAILGSSVGGTTANFAESATLTESNPLTLTLTSHFLGFLGDSEVDASFALSGLSGSFSVDVTSGSSGYIGGDYTGSGVGTFAAASGISTGSVPEPGTLPLTLIGGGLCGIAFIPRHRRSKIAPATGSNS
jgi:hypothetical protein